MQMQFLLYRPAGADIGGAREALPPPELATESGLRWASAVSGASGRGAYPPSHIPFYPRIVVFSNVKCHRFYPIERLSQDTECTARTISVYAVANTPSSYRLTTDMQSWT